MCSRYTETHGTAQWRDRFGVEIGPAGGFVPIEPRFNIAPSSEAGVVRILDGEKRADRMRWGMIPSWSKQGGTGMINARAETLAEKPSFRAAFKKRRCLVPADGFYEWFTDTDGRKSPVYFRLKDGPLFAFAGLWESWTDRESGESIESYCIVTTAPNDLVKPIHNRMPAILRREDESAWLESGPDSVAALLAPYTAQEMESRKVTRRVNRVGFEGPACLDPPDTAGLFE